MKNPSKIESDHLKYDVTPADDIGASTSHDDLEINRRVDDKASKAIAKGGKADTNVCVPDVKEDVSGEESCFEERRLKQRYFTLVSSDVDFTSQHVISYGH